LKSFFLKYNLQVNTDELFIKQHGFNEAMEEIFGAYDGDLKIWKNIDRLKKDELYIKGKI